MPNTDVQPASNTTSSDETNPVALIRPATLGNTGTYLLVSVLASLGALVTYPFLLSLNHDGLFSKPDMAAEVTVALLFGVLCCMWVASTTNMIIELCGYIAANNYKQRLRVDYDMEQEARRLQAEAAKTREEQERKLAQDTSRT